MSPRIDPETRRDEILDAALRCFQRTGYYRTSMDEVVKESGLSKGTLYWHFKNKEDIFLALFDRTVELIVAGVPAEFPPDLSAADRLRKMTYEPMDMLKENTELLTIPINFLMELWQHEHFVERYTGMMNEYATALQAIIDGGIASGEFRQVDSHGLTWALMALYDGLVLYYGVGMPGDQFAQTRTITDVIIEGLIAR